VLWVLFRFFITVIVIQADVFSVGGIVLYIVEVYFGDVKLVLEGGSP